MKERQQVLLQELLQSLSVLSYSYQIPPGMRELAWIHWHSPASSIKWCVIKWFPVLYKRFS